MGKASDERKQAPRLAGVTLKGKGQTVPARGSPVTSADEDVIFDLTVSTSN